MELLIDAHAHLGFDEVFDADFTEEELLESQAANGISVTLVQPAFVHDLETIRQYHDAVADLCRRYPGRFFGVAAPNPHLPGSQFADEARRCIKELNFVGLKLHPLAHAVNPAGRHGMRVFETAAELRVPVMVHTGNGLPWAAPSMLQPAARAFPHLPIVVAHAGGMICSGEAGILAEEHENIYLECSWIAGFLIRSWSRKLGPHRLMFGSDHADNAATEIEKVRTASLAEAEVDAILGGTAAKVFGISKQEGS